jgi:hypothetical protein
MPKIFVIMPFAHEFEPVYTLISQAAKNASPSAQVFRISDIPISGRIVESVYQSIQDADLIICDVSHSNPNVLYELGYAHALHKPVLMIAHKTESIPFDIKGSRVVVYDVKKRRTEFARQLEGVIRDALKNPSAFSDPPASEPSINSVFISYSHTDGEFLKRLLVHLRPLEREGVIDLWVDTKLEAGDKWKKQIEEALNRARVAILLVSADFLASAFIVDNELPPLLAKAESEGTRIVPVIIKPCRFTRDKNLNSFQAINDPRRPLVMLDEGEQEAIYDKVAELVERSLVR